MARFILSKNKVIEQYNKIKGYGIVSFSFKTNPVVGQLLEKETDSMFSVHFINELKLINDKSRVWFLAQALDTKLLDYLFKQNVNKFVIENIEDLDLLMDYITKNNKKIWLLLRMKLKEHTIKTERYYVFGMESKIINEKIKELYLKRNIEKIGIHVHRKTQNVSEWRLKEELSEILEVNVLKKINFLDIGGGIPIRYKNISDKVVDYVFRKIKEIKEWLDDLDIRLIIEPGRYISGPSLMLETNIVGIYGAGRDKTIVVDGSVYNCCMDTLIVPIKLLVKGEIEKPSAISSGVHQYIIKGITPCSTDIFRYRVYFNEKKKVGDKIIFLNAGAYNFHTEFCELDKIRVDIVDDFSKGIR